MPLLPPGRSNLESLGWDSGWEAASGGEGTVARVVMQSKRYLRVALGGGEEAWAEPMGRLLRQAHEADHLPVVGDWVILRPDQGGGSASIEGILPRRSALTRLAAGGRGGTQLLAANVDVAFVMAALDRAVNIRRLERYVTLAHQGGVRPVVLLSKSDVAMNLSQALDTVARLGAGVTAHPLCAPTGEGLDIVRDYLRPHQTGVLLGSSGAGKSTLANSLMGASVQAVQEARRRDGKGRHTTTARQLLLLPGGGILIDTPGMRELSLARSPLALAAAFQDIVALAEDCRFADCRHIAEPGCAVRQAVEHGAMPRDRLEGFLRLRDENPTGGGDKGRGKRYKKNHAPGERR